MKRQKRLCILRPLGERIQVMLDLYLPLENQPQSHYVYILTMNDNDKVKNMVKVWNAPWAMKELGWM